MVLCAGSLSEWSATSHEQWHERIQLLARTAIQGGAMWVTVIPNDVTSTEPASTDVASHQANLRAMLEQSCNATRYGDRLVVIADAGVTVIVDVEVDGRQRIVTAAQRLVGAPVSEQKLSSAISAPAPSDPDLVVVLGKPTVVPCALTWELAYAEIVFLDISWWDLQSEHLEMAVDDFTRRDRRFGGVDS
jgi:undecaprenyl diphosphate synthase